MENRRIPCDEVPGGCILTCCAHANDCKCLELVLLSTCYTRFLGSGDVSTNLVEIEGGSFGCVPFGGVVDEKGVMVMDVQEDVI
jgi:hypothetical protein